MAKMDSWLRDLVASLDAYADEETRATVLEACGRNCLPKSVVQRARALRREHADVDAWVTAMNAEHLAGGHLEREGETIHGRYERCYCSLAKGGGKGLSPTFCQCSRGWLEELFSQALAQPVHVEMRQTVVGGAPDCRFDILLGQEAAARPGSEKRWLDG